MRSNKNDSLLQSIKDLRDEISYRQFEFREHFSHLCNLQPDIENERLLVKPVNHKLFEEKGLVYVFCIDNKILKIGNTISEISKRIQSYNCGRQAFRDNGTCSTTNYFILQSLLRINKIVKVYAYFPEIKKYDIFGTIGKERFPSPKAVEKAVLHRFQIKHLKIPIGCTQK